MMGLSRVFTGAHSHKKVKKERRKKTGTAREGPIRLETRRRKKNVEAFCSASLPPSRIFKNWNLAFCIYLESPARLGFTKPGEGAERERQKQSGVHLDTGFRRLKKKTRLFTPLSWGLRAVVVARAAISLDYKRFDFSAAFFSLGHHESPTFSPSKISPLILHIRLFFKVSYYQFPVNFFSPRNSPTYFYDASATDFHPGNGSLHFYCNFIPSRYSAGGNECALKSPRRRCHRERDWRGTNCCSGLPRRRGQTEYSSFFPLFSMHVREIGVGISSRFPQIYSGRVKRSSSLSLLLEDLYRLTNEEYTHWPIIGGGGKKIPFRLEGIFLNHDKKILYFYFLCFLLLSFFLFFRASGTSPGLGIERFITETWPAARQLGTGKEEVFLFFLLFLTLGFINPKEEKRKVQKGEKGGKKRILSFLARGKMGMRGVVGWCYSFYPFSQRVLGRSPLKRKGIFLFSWKRFFFLFLAAQDNCRYCGGCFFVWSKGKSYEFSDENLVRNF